jgi:ADP-ribose pyrophosphatase
MEKLGKWKRLQSKMVVEHKFCKVRRDEIELPNGKIIDDFFVHIKPDIAYILAITTNKEIIFVRQYRYAIDDFFLELPAGGFDPATESAEVAAMRELKEETGYIAPGLKKLATLYDRPSGDTNRTHLFLAENALKVGEQNLDETEEIEVVLIPQEEVLNKIYQGEICVKGSVAALFIGLNLSSKLL